MYSLTRFGDLVLPLYNRETDMSPADAISTLVMAAGGAIDAAGSARSPLREPMPITMRCVLVGDTAADLLAQINTLRAAVGTRAWLYRAADADGTLHRCTARLMDVAAARKRGNILHAEVKLTWQAIGSWRGKRYENWTLDDGSEFDDCLYLDTGAVAITMDATTTVTNTGNLPVVDATLRVVTEAHSIQLWYFDMNAQNIHITFYVNTPAAGDEIVLNAGSKTITLNGADNYSRFGYDPLTHANADWIALAPGANLVELARQYPAPSSTAILEFAERWA